MTPPCQSCELKPSTVVEACDSADAPYLVCDNCHRRLMARALRPLEWFNLAKRFGWWQFLLHDDFYDEDGTATQPEENIEGTENLPAPTIAETTHNAESLLDFTVTRWRIDEDLSAAWTLLPQSLVKSTLERRFAAAANPGIRATVIVVASIALKSTGADFVRSAWNEYPDKLELWSLVRATAACLPSSEGFAMAVAAIDRLAGRAQRDAMLSLSYFQSPDALRWIETNAQEPTTEQWGNLAASSGLTWATVAGWLAKGRPLSLIAIDALVAIAEPRTPLLKSIAPTLLQPPNTNEFISALSDCVSRDGVPRVKQRAQAAMNYSHRLCADA